MRKFSAPLEGARGRPQQVVGQACQQSQQQVRERTRQRDQHHRRAAALPENSRVDWHGFCPAVARHHQHQRAERVQVPQGVERQPASQARGVIPEEGGRAGVGVLVQRERDDQGEQAGNQFGGGEVQHCGSAGIISCGYNRLMLPEIALGDRVRLRKAHPCGGFEWEVVRLGADIGLVCLTCGHRVLLTRRELARRMKALLPKEGKEG